MNTILAFWTAEHLQQATQGQWFALSPQLEQGFAATTIKTDQRQIQQGDVFLAIKGERFDAHDFVAGAAQNGAVAAIVERYNAQLNLPQLVVANTRLALGQLGAYYRKQFKQLNVVAITGSSGKTTTKEMLGSILSQQARTLITRGNLNNDLGVPMMLLELNSSQQYAVLELGANHVGEIAYTTQLVKPQVAVVLNIGTAHMGEFGGRENIAKTKAEIYLGLPQTGVAIYNADDDFSVLLCDKAEQHHALSFSLNNSNANFYAGQIQLFAQHSQFVLHTPKGQMIINLPFAGQHNIYNALAAAASAYALDVALPIIAQGLNTASAAKGRLNFSKWQGHTIIDDTYNANPHAVIAAAQVLTNQQGTKVLVLGDIAELGDEAETQHTQLGEQLAQMDIEHLIAVGQYAQHVLNGCKNKSSNIKAEAFAQKPQALAHLQQLLAQQSQLCILFKGSRSASIETLIHDITHP